MDGDGQATVERGRGPLMAALVLGVFVLLVIGVVIVGSRDSSNTEQVGTDGDAPTSLQVATGDLDGVDGLPQVVAVDGHLVGFAFPWGQHTAWWSSDWGRSWQASSGLPGSVDGFQVITVDDRLFVAENRFESDESPALWRSDDGGQNFVPVAGIAAEGTATKVLSILAVDGDLVAFGLRNRPSEHTWRWTSGDGGATWTGAAISGDGSIGAGAVVLAGEVMVSTRSEPSTTIAPDASGRWPAPSSPGLVRSDDDGITWETVELPGWIGESTEDVISAVSVVDDHVVASSRKQTFLADEPVDDWRLLDTAPPLPDEAGNLPPDYETGAVQIFEVDGDHLVAQIGAFYNNDHSIGRLGWSDDGGASWQAADMGVSCDGYDAQAALGAPVRLGGNLVAAWNCLGEGDSGGHLLVSTDDGRTWRPDPSVSDLMVEDAWPHPQVSPPLLIDDHVVALLSANPEQGTDGWIDVTLGE